MRKSSRKPWCSSLRKGLRNIKTMCCDPRSGLTGQQQSQHEIFMEYIRMNGLTPDEWTKKQKLFPQSPNGLSSKSRSEKTNSKK